MGNKGLIGAKIEKIELGEKSDHYCKVKLCGGSNGDSLDALIHDVESPRRPIKTLFGPKIEKFRI